MAVLPAIIPISDLCQDAASVIERVVASGEPVVITQRGRAAAVLVSAEAYERTPYEDEVLRALARGDAVPGCAAESPHRADDLLTHHMSFQLDAAFPGGSVDAVARYPRSGANPANKPPGSVLTVDFSAGGQSFTALMCADQAEVDRFTDALGAGGGEEGPCGWLRDRFDVGWQVVPEAVAAWLTSDDEAARDRVDPLRGPPGGRRGAGVRPWCISPFAGSRAAIATQ